jgi:hypothetical protein
MAGRHFARRAARAGAFFWTPLILVGTAMPWAAVAATSQADPFPATSSRAARVNAIQSIPFEKLDADGRAKVDSVLSNITVFRRLPTRMVSCDPDLYLFLVRHPDVVVNIWEVLGISQLQLRQTGPETYRVNETEGTSAWMEFLYHSRDMHILYAEWTYTGPLLARRIGGRCLAVLKSGFLRESDGRYFVTTQLDGFMSANSGAIDLLAKTLSPLVTKNADLNFVQTVAFVGSLSRTAEVNAHGMQRLAEKLTYLQPEVRRQLSEVVNGVAWRAAARSAPGSDATRPLVANRDDNSDDR